MREKEISVYVIHNVNLSNNEDTEDSELLVRIGAGPHKPKSQARHPL